MKKYDPMGVCLGLVLGAIAIVDAVAIYLTMSGH